MGETFVASKATTSHFFGYEHVVRTKTGQCRDLIAQSHFLHGTGDVQGNGLVGWPEFQLVLQKSIDEFGRLVQSELLDGVTHAIQTGTLVAQHRIFSVLTGLEQCRFQFGCFAVGHIRHTFAFPNGTAT